MPTQTAAAEIPRIPTADRAAREARARRADRARRPRPPSLRAAIKRVTRRPTPPHRGLAQRVLAYALAQRGDPYVWGAAGPNAWDCSGLVVGAYRSVGIRLPHYTGALLRRGRRVTRSAMRPGDLVFTSSHHVGLYLGGGRMVVAPHTGTVVRIQDVYAFYTARRIIT